MLEELQERVKQAPDDPAAWYELAAKQAAYVRWDECIKDLRRAFELNAPILEQNAGQTNFMVMAWRDYRFRLLRQQPMFKQLMEEVDPKGESLAVATAPPVQEQPAVENAAASEAGLQSVDAVPDEGPPAPSIPPRPRDGDFFHDLAGIISDGDEQTIRDLQQATFGRHGVPIVVVTINAMSDHEPGAVVIESFAARWFNAWGIGSKSNNSGMLILVSKADRKARIELGADWGRKFDTFCRQLMDKKMVPQFKQGNFGAGLVAAVRSLSEIAKAGPKAEPPGPNLTERIVNNPVTNFATLNNPVAAKTGPGLLTLMMGAGFLCLIASAFMPEYRRALLIAGAVLLGLVFLFWILVILFVVILVIFQGSRYGGYHGGSWGDGGGGFSGGGGFGGGFSGGGGASGSW